MRTKKEKWKIYRDGDGFPGLVVDQDWVLVADCYAASGHAVRSTADL